MDRVRDKVMVVNLNTGAEYLYMDCSPREAVKLAYAQFERKDNNWWRDHYAQLEVMVGNYFVTCGDYAARYR